MVLLFLRNRYFYKVLSCLFKPNVPLESYILFDYIYYIYIIYTKRAARAVLKAAPLNCN